MLIRKCNHVTRIDSRPLMTSAEEDEGGTAAVDSSSEPTGPASADEKPDICPLKED